MYGPWHDLLPFALSVKGEMTAGELIVGVGTGALAAFTAWLAARTSREVKLTERGLGLTRESIEALDRPFVVVTPNEHHQAVAFRDVETETGPRTRFVFRLWNIGKGPAIVYEVSLRGPDGQEFLTWPGVEWPIAVAPWGRDEMLPFAAGVPGVGARLDLRVRYRSASQTHYETRSALTVEEELLCNCRDFRRVPLDEPSR